MAMFVVTPFPPPCYDPATILDLRITEKEGPGLATRYKRGNTWWVAIFVGGRRVQQSFKAASKTLATEAVKAIKGDMVRLTHGLPVARASARVQWRPISRTSPSTAPIRAT